MPLIRSVRGFAPKLGAGCFLAETAVVIGDTVLGDGCSVWYNAVVRGDVNSIRIGDRVNIQDGAVLHCTYEKCGLTIGSDVSIGHNAIVHGCTVHDKVLIGMGAIVMDQAVIGLGSVAAVALPPSLGAGPAATSVFVLAFFGIGEADALGFAALSWLANSLPPLVLGILPLWSRIGRLSDLTRREAPSEAMLKEPPTP